MFNRMNEIDFRTKTDERLYRLEDTVRELRYKVESLEQSIRQPVPVVSPTTTPYEPAPYWTNPSWKAPDITCTTASTEQKT